MRVGTFQLFDETISGTGNTWYTPTETYEPLGRADLMSFSAAVYNATGTPTLVVQVEHSGDGQNWTSVNTAAEVNSSISGSNAIFIGNPNAGAGSGIAAMFLHFVRMRVQLTAGTNPQCRLKIGATTRSL